MRVDRAIGSRQYVEAVALGVIDPSESDVYWEEWESALRDLGYRLGMRFAAGMVELYRGDKRLYSQLPIYVSRFVMGEQEDQ